MLFEIGVVLVAVVAALPAGLGAAGLLLVLESDVRLMVAVVLTLEGVLEAVVLWRPAPLRVRATGFFAVVGVLVLVTLFFILEVAVVVRRAARLREVGLGLG